MDPDILNSITPPSIESPVIRVNNNRPERQRTLSIGPSLNSNANFYDIPAVNWTRGIFIELTNNQY